METLVQGIEVSEVARERAKVMLLTLGGQWSVRDGYERLGMKRDEVEAEIKRLEEGKIILGYRAVINPEKVGKETVVAIIEVKVSPQREVGFDAIARRIYKFPEVRSCYLVSG